MSAAPSASALFLIFSRLALSGIGGVLPHARHALVEQQGWLSEREFAELVAIGQVLPGPNIFNIAIMIGQRFRGLPGALAAVSGVTFFPFCLMLLIAFGFKQIADQSWVKPVMQGIGAGAAGLFLATAASLLRALPRRLWVLLVAGVAWALVALAHLPLGWVIVLAGALGLICAWWTQR